MSNCCTPEYIKIPSVSVSGDIILNRGTGYAPSCGYYEYFSGTSGLGYSDYYEVDVQYNSGSGFWTFSGNSTGFDDSTVYRSVKTGNPCDPLGSYTGGFYSVNILEGNKFNMYDFEPSFISADENDGQAVGKGIHKNKDVKFSFNFTNNDFIKTICYDVLRENGTTIYQDYLKSIVPSVTITEEENIKIFGSYTKDFGVRARVIDKYLGETSSAEFYAYGNVLYIDSLSVQDREGTTNWNALSDSEEAQTEGLIPSGYIEEQDPKIKVKANLFESISDKVNLSHLNIYASETKDFQLDGSTLRNKIPLTNGTVSKDLEVNESFNIEPNKDYYFALEGYSSIGKGNSVRFGPHKIFQKEEAGKPIETQDAIFLYKDSSYLNQFKTGDITENVTGYSGILDTLIVNKEDYGLVKEIHDAEKFLFTTLPTNASGKWVYTSFDYNFEFKDKDDEYSNLNKKIKLTATGTSSDPLNSGMPMFSIADENTGSAVELDLLYNESGMYLVCNTGHGYEYYKYRKDSF